MSGLHDELSRFVQKNLTCLGQRYAPLIAQKEGNPQILLELANLTTQRWLCDVELLRGLTEVKVFRNSDEVPNVT